MTSAIYLTEALLRCFRRGQHRVRQGLVGSRDAEQGWESSVPGSPAVEAKDEFIEVRLEVLAAQPVIDAQSPDLEVGKDPVHPGQDNVSGHFTDDMGIMGDAGGAGYPDQPSVLAIAPDARLVARKA